MKKRTLSLLTVVFGLCVLIFACRREIDDVVKTNLTSTSRTLLESAKTWNEKIVSENFAVNSKIPGFITLDPQWNNSWTVRQQDGTTLIAVPTAVGDPSVRSITLGRLFVFKAKDNKITGAEIVEFLGFKDYSVTKNLENLVKNYQSTSIENFNGAIIKYDLNYRWTSGSTYDGGQKSNDNVSIVRIKAPENPSSGLTIALNIPSRSNSGLAVNESKSLYTISGLITMSGSGSGSGGGSGSGSGSGSMGGTLSEVVITGSTSGGGGGTPPIIIPPPGGNPGTTLPPTGGGGSTPPPTDLSVADKKISCGTLPAKSGESTQVGSLCVFKTLEWVTKYYGGMVPSGTSLAAYVNSYGGGVSGAINVTNNGVPASDINGIIGRHCNFKTPSSIQDAINNCHPVMAILSGSHEVMITGYNNSGTIQYFDPQLGTYQVTSSSSLSSLQEITGNK